MAELRIGTCSWKYDSWKGLVYSPVAGQDMLQEYAQKYHTVEIDQWFWALHGPDKLTLPLPHVVKQYVQSVPASFKFTIKAANSLTLTHFYRKSADQPLVPNPHFLSTELYAQFIHCLQPMHPMIGVLMFQFEYLNKQKQASQQIFQDTFHTFLKGIDRTIPLGIEIRNPNWLNLSFLEFLHKNELYMVFLQGYYMPTIFPLYKKFKSYFQKTVVIRLHGPDRSFIEKKSAGQWNSILAPKDAELPQIVAMVDELLDSNVNVYLNVNNHYEGSAPLTIEKLKVIGLARHLA